MDFEHCRMRMPWLSQDQIRPRANFREKIGMKRWAEQVEGLIGSLAGKRVGVDIWDLNMEAAIRETSSRAPTFADGYQSVLMRAKEIKTQDEIICLKIANAITEAALDRALQPTSGNQGMRSPGHRLGNHDRDGQRMDAVLEYRLFRTVYRALSALHFGPHHPQRRPGDYRHRRLLQRLLGRSHAHLGLRQREAHG